MRSNRFTKGLPERLVSSSEMFHSSDSDRGMGVLAGAAGTLGVFQETEGLGCTGVCHEQTPAFEVGQGVPGAGVLGACPEVSTKAFAKTGVLGYTGVCHGPGVSHAALEVQQGVLGACPEVSTEAVTGIADGGIGVFHTARHTLPVVTGLEGSEGAQGVLAGVEGTGVSATTCSEMGVFHNADGVL